MERPSYKIKGWQSLYVWASDSKIYETPIIPGKFYGGKEQYPCQLSRKSKKMKRNWVVETVYYFTIISNLFLLSTMLDCISRLSKSSGTKWVSYSQWNVGSSDTGHFQAWVMEHNLGPSTPDLDWMHWIQWRSPRPKERAE